MNGIYWKSFGLAVLAFLGFSVSANMLVPHFPELVEIQKANEVRDRAKLDGGVAPSTAPTPVRPLTSDEITQQQIDANVRATPTPGQ
jgi:hypothetical protein